jgi:hypothetical protein
MHAAVEQRVRDILAQGEKGGNHAS